MQLFVVLTLPLSDVAEQWFYVAQDMLMHKGKHCRYLEQPHFPTLSRPHRATIGPAYHDRHWNCPLDCHPLLYASIILQASKKFFLVKRTL